jgi:hypothetical protein
MSRVPLPVLAGIAACNISPDGSGVKLCGAQYYYQLTTLDGPLVVDSSDFLVSTPELSVTTVRDSDRATKTDVQEMLLAAEKSQFTFDSECGYDGHRYPCRYVRAPHPPGSCRAYDAHLEFELIPPADWPESLQTWDPIPFEFHPDASLDELHVCLWNDWCVEVDW